MAKSPAHVIAVDNDGVLDHELILPASDDHYTIFAEYYRMGYKGETYTLYRVENGERVFVETYKYDDK